MDQKSKRGFASMKDKTRLKEICSMGGKAATNRHKWTTEEAQEAGRKGGSISRRRSKVASRNPRS